MYLQITLLYFTFNIRPMLKEKYIKCIFPYKVTIQHCDI